MAPRMGLLGKKVGMTQVFDDGGNCLPVSVVEVGPCVVLGIKNRQHDGYAALQLGFDDQKPQRVNRPRSGIFAKAQTAPKRVIREVRLGEDEIGQFKVGQVLSVADVFRKNDAIDITGISRGKGFQGVMKRHHFSGFRATHGTHEYFRHGGSIGCRLTPGRVYKGRKMPGQMGNRRVTVQNLSVYDVLPEKNLMLVRGAVPGAPDNGVLVRFATKRKSGSFELRVGETPAPPAADGAETAAPAQD